MLAGRVEALVNLIEALACLWPKCERVDETLLADILLDMGAKLALDTLLLGEALIGETGDEPGGAHGQRRHENHDERHGHGSREHEAKRADYGHDATQELVGSLQKTVTDLVNVIHDATDEVAVRMRVDERQGHAIELVRRGITKIANGLV